MSTVVIVLTWMQLIQLLQLLKTLHLELSFSLVLSFIAKSVVLQRNKIAESLYVWTLWSSVITVRKYVFLADAFIAALKKYPPWHLLWFPVTPEYKSVWLTVWYKGKRFFSWNFFDFYDCFGIWLMGHTITQVLQRRVNSAQKSSQSCV